jgi:hypothetical protein
MVSQEKNEANRRNAKRSTCPRTAAGKETSSRNSRRHGLASSVLRDPIWAYEVHKLAKIFMPKGAKPDHERAIKTILAAIVDVMRVQAARTEVWNAALIRRSVSEQQDGRVDFNWGPEGPIDGNEDAAYDADALVGVQVLPQLLKLERYHRRAEAYCKHVISEFDGVWVESPFPFT